MTNVVENGNVFVALYDFKAERSDTLSLSKGEKVLLLDDVSGLRQDNPTRQTSPWTLVQNTRGEIGFTPTDYLSNVKVPLPEELDFIEGCIEVIHIQATSAGGKYTSQQHACLQKLVGMRSDILGGRSHRTDTGKVAKRKAPLPPVRTSSSLDANLATSDKFSNISTSNDSAAGDAKISELEKNFSCNASQEICDHDNQENDLPQDSQQNADEELLQNVPTELSCETDFKRDIVPENLGLNVIELIRSETGASHQKSVSAAIRIMSLLSSSIPSLSDVFSQIYESISNTTTVAQKLESEDGRKMIAIIQELEELKDDGHGLNWNINNEEGIIIQHVNDLTSLLSEADVEVSRIVLEHLNYAVVTSLVTYYRMDHRDNIRENLLELFQCFCLIDAKIISILVASILPLELARELLTCNQDGDKLCGLGYLLMLLFSTGEKIPVNHYEHLNCDFVEVILNRIDEFDDSESRSTDVLVSVILAFNLHFQDRERNIVIEALTKKETAKSFTEKIMLLINREADPIDILENVPVKINSVIKLILDMFDSNLTSQLFYTNDVKVLMDIVLRQISDLSSSEKMRSVYLTLLHKIILNSAYSEHQHRLTDIQLVLNQILNEEDCKEVDKNLSEDIKTLLKTPIEVK